MAVNAPNDTSPGPRDRVAAEFAGDLGAYMRQVGRTAREVSAAMAVSSTAQRNGALTDLAHRLRAGLDELLAANGRDVARARGHGLAAAHDRSPDDEREVGRADGRRRGAGRAVARSDRRDHRRPPAAQRHPRGPHARAARCDRHHLREPAQRDRRRRDAVPQERQRDDPARRFGSDREQSPAGAADRRGARRRRPARRGGAADRHHRPRRRRRCWSRCRRTSTSSSRAGARD